MEMQTHIKCINTMSVGPQNRVLLKSSCMLQFPASFICWTMPWDLIKEWTIVWQVFIKVASGRNYITWHILLKGLPPGFWNLYTLEPERKLPKPKTTKSAGMVKPKSQPSWSWIHTITVPEISAPALSVKWCQLKKELFLVLSSSSVSSNWSAPKDARQGLCPPYPIAAIYKPKKNMMCWHEIVSVQAAQTCGSIEINENVADRTNIIIP